MGFQVEGAAYTGNLLGIKTGMNLGETRQSGVAKGVVLWVVRAWRLEEIGWKSRWRLTVKGLE